MILFFSATAATVIATEIDHQPNQDEIDKLSWLYGDAKPMDDKELSGYYLGPRREMITPWSTNAVEITQNMGLSGISRIEEYFPTKSLDDNPDPMIFRNYDGLNQQIFTIDLQPEPIRKRRRLGEIQRGGRTCTLTGGNRVPAQGREGEWTPTDRLGSVRLRTNQLGALPTQNIRR